MVQIIDCDVEEPNAHLLMQPEFPTKRPLVLVPEVDRYVARCSACARACQFSAIAVIRQAVLTFHDLCAGCGACAYVCPVDAITVTRRVGTVQSGHSNAIDFVTGTLNVGDQRATPVTRAVKDRIRDDLITILDAPPGTACPMQETVEGSDYCILVTEPTPFGLSNLQDAVETCRRIGVSCGVIINRDGSGNDGVERYCAQEGIEVLLRVPQDRRIAEAYSRGETLVAAMPQWGDELVAVYHHITEVVAAQATTEGVS